MNFQTITVRTHGPFPLFTTHSLSYSTPRVLPTSCTCRTNCAFLYIQKGVHGTNVKNTHARTRYLLDTAGCRTNTDYTFVIARVRGPKANQHTSSFRRRLSSSSLLLWPHKAGPYQHLVCGFVSSIPTTCVLCCVSRFVCVRLNVSWPHAIFPVPYISYAVDAVAVNCYQLIRRRWCQRAVLATNSRWARKSSATSLTQQRPRCCTTRRYACRFHS